MRHAHRLRFLFGFLIVVLGLSIGNSLFAQGDPPPPEEVTIPGVVSKVIDGVTTTDIQGTFFRAPANGDTPQRALLMLPMLSNMMPNGTIIADRAELLPFGLAFQAEGFHVLTVNTDGYSYGTGQAPTMVDGLQDVQAAYNWLASQAGVDPNRVGVLGSSIGANYALMLMEAIPSIPVGLIFSPAPDYGGLMPNPSALINRMIHVYAGTEESADPTYLSWLQQYTSLTIPGSGHGTFLYNDPALLNAQMEIWRELMLLADQIDAGTISYYEAWDRIYDLWYERFSMFCPAPPLIVLGGGLLLRRRKRRSNSHP